MLADREDVHSTGDSQPAKAAPSREHSNSTTGWSDENVNVADVGAVVAGGPTTIVVSGGTGATTVHAYAGTVPTRSRASTARTVS